MKSSVESDREADLYRMVGRKGKNILRAGTQAQADKILKEQEDLISRVCDEVTDGDDDITNTNAQNKAITGVIEAYTRVKLDKQKNLVKALTTVSEDSVTRNVTQKLKDIATDFDLDASYYNKEKLLTYLQLLSENLNLLKAISVTLVSECPKNKSEFIKLFKRPENI